MTLLTTVVLLLLQSILSGLVVKVFAQRPHQNPFAGFGRPFVPSLPAPGAPVCNVGPTACEDSPYRTLDGSCNNLAYPQLGIANSKFARLLPAKYSDGILQPTSSLAGGPLPNPRLLSLELFGELDFPDPDFTLMNMQWGSVIAGDFSRTVNGSVSKRYVPCCTPEGRLIETNPEICFNIEIPPEDIANKQAGNECMQFVRTLTDEGADCNYNGGPVEQLNGVSSYMDLSMIYGDSNEVSRRIRAFQGGRLIVEERNGHTWLPKNPNSTLACNVEDESGICYAGGDFRVNVNPGATIMSTMLVREHNRLADQLASINPHWSDEVLFQEARKINVAQIQQISYYELLPILLGRENMLKNKLIYDVPADSYVNDYNPNIDATILNEFTTSAYRHFHSQVEGRLDLVSELRSVFGSLRLSDWFRRPEIIEFEDNFDSLTRGLGSQPQQLTDINFDREIKHFMFRMRNKQLGSDLRAIDIQRSRDHGLASYNDYREFCGIRRANNWEDFADLINIHSIEGLQTIYKSPEDVDLTVGGSLEYPVAGALAGPTFLCILTEQLYRTRVGDRFFFENYSPKTGFTKEQLREIRKATVARLMCDNGNQIQTMQPRAFLTVSKTNPITPCADLPSLDLTKWIDKTKGQPLKQVD